MDQHDLSYQQLKICNDKNVKSVGVIKRIITPRVMKFFIDIT
jgi:hypothetical protein